MNAISIVFLVVSILAVCTVIYLLCSSEVKYLTTIKRNCLMAKIVTKYTYKYIDKYKIDFSWWEDKKISVDCIATCHSWNSCKKRWHEN